MDECDAANKTLRFKVVITTAELPDNATRSLIQEKFRAEVYDHYGLEEVGPVAWECPTREGYHLNSESLLIEVMKDGRPVREDEPGELYVSSLYQMATPMLRYNTEDRATLSSDRCPCGRGLARLKSIEGRSFDFVLTSDGHRVSPILIMGTLESANGVEQYRLIQNTDSSIDVLVVAKQVGSETIIQELTSRCNLLFGNTIVRIKLVNKIDVKTRKFRFIESHVTHS
jgi:phenylacetate-CoA ligase